MNTFLNGTSALRLLLLFLISGTLSCAGLNVKGVNVGKAVQGTAQVVSGISQALDDLEKEDELAIGRAVSARVLGRSPRDTTEWDNRYVNLVGKLVASQRFKRDGRLDIFHFSILDTDKINAYSTPGGYVFITRGLLDLCRNEAELAAVLAHEIAHIQHAHVLKAIESNREQEGFTRAISGAANVGAAMAEMNDGSQAAQNLLKATSEFGAKLLFEQGFSPEQELESDKLAAKLASNAGYRPLSLVDILKRIQENRDVNPSNQTHPTTDDRVRTLREYITSENLGDGVKAKERFTNYLAGGA